jgi:glucose/arabinose dehydrogenase
LHRASRARGLSHPWSLAWLPDGRIVLNETGEIRREALLRDVHRRIRGNRERNECDE